MNSPQLWGYELGTAGGSRRSAGCCWWFCVVALGGGRECLAQGAGYSTVLLQGEYEGQKGSSSAVLLGPFTGLRDARGRAAGRSRIRVRAGLLCAVSFGSVFSESFDFAAIKASPAVSPSCRSSSFVVLRVRSAGSCRRGGVCARLGGRGAAPRPRGLVS